MHCEVTHFNLHQPGTKKVDFENESRFCQKIYPYAHAKIDDLPLIKFS